ncbi:hypothetical protein H4S02_009177 [Coemansia sp. RSA 2611]|nr:hypothetical protein IWW52_005531 [Coemansia sp. RSA 2704]KAJ2319064.1 hypothetical protein IWW51_004955 [Coemansia sp. RSA 2702]KAJ2356855.1 hypothetical protein H4S01_006613 [Coemansia sp. RSA 2610]KAJ2372527.1 hypothetical protein H4S02_009177 [Coemansia sp. RSA 2611]
MHAPVAYPAARLRCEPVAEVSGVVAGHKPVRLARPAKAAGAKAVLPLRRSAPLLSRLGAAPAKQHERTLDILRSVLASALATAGASDDADPATPQPRWDDALAEKRAAFVDALRELQHPHADAIGAISELLDNRVRLGLLSAAAARDFAATADDAALTLANTPATSLSSSLGSDESGETLAADEPERLDPIAWAHSQWRSARRGRSIASDATLVEPTAAPDDMGVCWPLDYGSSRACGRFFADLGEVRVPSRFRVPQNSLAMLAGEQLMMRNDKIVCPLKNRLQEVNPRRQCFEDYVRATGAIPPPPAAVRPPSRLRDEC